MITARLSTLGRVAATVAMAISIAIGGLAIGAPGVAAFTGHGCTRATCQYFTSSYYTTKYYYNRKTCSEWKSLSNTYLQSFKISSALLAKYPSRKLHKPC